MQYVNFTDPALPRYYKASFFEYISMFQTYQEDYADTPNPYLYTGH